MHAAVQGAAPVSWIQAPGSWVLSPGPANHCHCCSSSLLDKQFRARDQKKYMRNAPTERRGGVIEKENEKHAASQKWKGGNLEVGQRSWLYPSAKNNQHNDALRQDHREKYNSLNSSHPHYKIHLRSPGIPTFSGTHQIPSFSVNKR